MSIACGIFGLIFDQLSAKVPSATLTLAGIIALYMSFYNSAEYESAGKELTIVYNELRDLYRSVQSGADIEASLAQMKILEQRYYATCISKQILFSDWYAHFKFFGQHQTGWVNEQLQFGFWKDKIPASVKPLIVILTFFLAWCALGIFGVTYGPLGAFGHLINWSCPKP